MKTNKTLTESENLTLAHELKAIVSKWVDTFNFIQLSTLEKVTDNMLFEYIEQNEIDFKRLSEYSGDSIAKVKKECAGIIQDHRCFDSCIEEDNQNNYPMWNTLFEFKEKQYDDVINAAKKAGFGIIDGIDDFNQILFVSGCGYSFYGAHWIPLFLELPWNTDLKAKYKDVNYLMM